MKCTECSSKPLYRGIVEVVCTQCGKRTYTDPAFKTHVCHHCSEQMKLCQYCGVSVK